jgi:hypothetical protein
MKYIIFRVKHFELPVIFHEVLPHDTIAVKDGTPVAAGFIDEAGVCSGRSVGLKLESRQQDTEIVKNARELWK